MRTPLLARARAQHLRRPPSPDCLINSRYQHTRAPPREQEGRSGPRASSYRLGGRSDHACSEEACAARGGQPCRTSARARIRPRPRYSGPCSSSAAGAAAARALGGAGGCTDKKSEAEACTWLRVHPSQPSTSFSKGAEPSGLWVTRPEKAQARVPTGASTAGSTDGEESVWVRGFAWLHIRRQARRPSTA